MEAIGGLRLIAAGKLAVTLGGGAGLDRAIGAPDARFFASVGYAPELRDTDHDGIPNDKDKSPRVAEDKDGFEDEDGCPDDDNDKDGILDSEDKCPNQAEDHDGFEDDDGCPDPENDKDGILDHDDKCPNEAETFNGIDDEDGCPDTGGLEMVVKLDGDRLEVTKVPTLDGRSLSKQGEIIVSQMALVMNSAPVVTKWLVALGQPSAGDAKRLADAVKARLEQRGVQNLQVIGATGSAKSGAVVQVGADGGTPPPYCAELLLVKPDPTKITPKATMKDRSIVSPPAAQPQSKPDGKGSGDTDIDMGNKGVRRPPSTAG